MIIIIKDSNDNKKEVTEGGRCLICSFPIGLFVPIIFRLVIPYHCCHIHIYPLSKNPLRVFCFLFRSFQLFFMSYTLQGDKHWQS